MIALIAVLLRTGLQAAEDAIMQAMLLSLCLSLFTSYPFNSILHHKVHLVSLCHASLLLLGLQQFLHLAANPVDSIDSGNASPKGLGIVKCSHANNGHARGSLTPS